VIIVTVTNSLDVEGAMTESVPRTVRGTCRGGLTGDASQYFRTAAAIFGQGSQPATVAMDLDGVDAPDRSFS
jgi:hypothetical protein